MRRFGDHGHSEGTSSKAVHLGFPCFLSRGTVSAEDTTCSTPRLSRLDDWTVEVSWQLDPNWGPGFLFRLESFGVPHGATRRGSLHG